MNTILLETTVQIDFDEETRSYLLKDLTEFTYSMYMSHNKDPSPAEHNNYLIFLTILMQKITQKPKIDAEIRLVALLSELELTNCIIHYLLSLLKYESTVTEVAQILTHSVQFGKRIQQYVSQDGGVESLSNPKKVDDYHLGITFVHKLHSVMKINWSLSVSIRLIIVLLKRDDNQTVIGTGRTYYNAYTV